MKKLFYVGSLCASLFLSGNLYAQDAQNKIERSAFWGNDDSFYLEKQVAQMFGLVDQALDEYPPVVGAPMPRKLALYHMDAILHETKYDESKAFYSFIASRTSKVLADMEKPLTEGMTIYKIYNEAIIARTASVTLAFDLTYGTGDWLFIPDEMVKQLVDRCDALFLTHNHNDHVDPRVVDLFLKAGKPVIAPHEILSDNKAIQHEYTGKLIKKSLKLKSGKKVQMHIFPGHQDHLQNNIYVITTPEKLTVAHAGDQYHKEDMEWIVTAKQHIPQVDALVVNCWTHRMADVVAGFNPKVVLPAHENEKGHLTIDHREAFWLTYQKMEKIQAPYVVMGWGEWYHCR